MAYSFENFGKKSSDPVGIAFILDCFGINLSNADLIFLANMISTGEPIEGVVVKGNFVFWFGALFNSTLNFTQTDDLSYSARTFHFRPANWVSCQTHSLWLENAVQCRRHTGRSSITFSLAG